MPGMKHSHSAIKTILLLLIKRVNWRSGNSDPSNLHGKVRAPGTKHLTS